MATQEVMGSRAERLTKSHKIGTMLFVADSPTDVSILPTFFTPRDSASIESGLTGRKLIGYELNTDLIPGIVFVSLTYAAFRAYES